MTKRNRPMAMPLFMILVFFSLFSEAQNVGHVRAQMKAPNKTSPQAPAIVVTSSDKATSLKSYRQWKNERIHEAFAKVSMTKSLLEVRKIAQSQPAKTKTEAVTMKDLNTAQAETQLKSDLMALEMAKDLTVSDYFAGYLSKLPQRSEAVKEIAAKMTTEEVAELMMAYSNSLFGSSPAGLPVQAQQGLGR